MVKQGLPDDYDFQLSLGPLKNTTERFYKDNFFWQEMWMDTARPSHLEVQVLP